LKLYKTLLVDTNRASYTIYQSILDCGHEVWVVGANPQEPLAKICPNFVELDYSDPARLDDLIAREGFDFLVPGCTDVSYKVCAEVNSGRFRGIDTIEATRTINEKAEFRAAAMRLGIPVPRVLDWEKAVGAPAVIVKPVDSFSGRGIAILRNPTSMDLDVARANAIAASKSGTALVEEFVEGQLYSHSAFLRGGEVVADFIVQEDCTTHAFTVDTSRVVFDFSQPILGSLRADACKLSSGLGLVDGLIHAQFILSEDYYWIVEVTRRCPGDLYALLIELSTGYPYGESYAAPFIGDQAQERNACLFQKRIIRHTVTSKDGEFLWGLRFRRALNLKLCVPLATAGDYIKPSPYDRAGLFFLEATSEAERDEIYADLIARNLYHFKL
jgi:hypothetical protein